MVEIFNRINGFDTALVAIDAMGKYGAELNIRDLWGTSLIEKFRVHVYGSGDVISSFGLTQVASLYIVGGYTLLVLGMFVIAVFIKLLVFLLGETGLKGNTQLKEAVFPIFGVFFIKLMFGGGNFLLSFKEILVLIAFLFMVMVVRRIRFSSKARVYSLI